jgi:signal transduction histidine kinase
MLGWREMRILPKRLSFSMALIVSLAAILMVLAVLQYLWSGQISEAERERMRSNLRNNMEQFSFLFNNELRQLGYSFQPNPTVLMLKNWSGYAATCDSALRASSHHLVRNIYLWISDRDSGSQLLKLNRSAKTFEASPWPPNFELMRERYDRYFSTSGSQEPEFRPFMSNFSSRAHAIIQPLMTFPGNSQGIFQGRSGPPGGGRSGRNAPGSGMPGRGMPGGGMPGGGMPGGGMPGGGMPGGGMPGGGMPGGGMQWVGFLLIELDLDNLRNELFAELAQKYFKGPNGFIYQVAVIGGHNHDTILYQSDPQLTIASYDSADARIGLMENRFGPIMARSDRESDSPGRGRDFEPSGRGNMGPPGMQFRPDMQPSNVRSRRGPSSFFSDPTSGWELIAKHRIGSLEKAVAASRRRNLALSFGSLLLLAVSTAFIIASARRAQSLARLQIDFVAGISHELRTPLAVICSASDNLAEGVIADTGPSTRKYGELIRNEGRKLAVMIEQILQYAGGRKGRRRYNLRPEPLNDIAEAALHQLQPALVDAGFTVEKSLAPDLPRIQVDAAVLSQGIQNLIRNALKYSGQSRWLAIRTLKVPNKRHTDVHLTVEDKGMGIDGLDLPHIFEPFYRGNAAVSAQIHGTGLGLYMVREDLISMGGSISVKSAPGKGSSFTIALPGLPDSEDPPARKG